MEMDLRGSIQMVTLWCQDGHTHCFRSAFWTGYFLKPGTYEEILTAGLMERMSTVSPGHRLNCSLIDCNEATTDGTHYIGEV